MATQSPFSFLGGVFERIAAGPQPPQWLVHEVQHRVVLLLNHVLMQDSVAMQRLQPQRGRVVRVQWRQFFMALQVTPAGLFDMAPEAATPDLRLEVTQSSPLDLAQAYRLGANSYIRKPVDFDRFERAIGLIGHYWLELNETTETVARGAY